MKSVLSIPSRKRPNLVSGPVTISIDAQDLRWSCVVGFQNKLFNPDSPVWTKLNHDSRAHRVKANPLRLRGLDNKELFLRGWFLANLVLIYVPVDFQIHMLNGWQVPIAILATWCFARLGFEPLRFDQTITVNAYLPTSAIGNVIHMKPTDGLIAETGWIRRVIEDPQKEPDGRTTGLATWKLRPVERSTPVEYILEVRYGRKTYPKRLLVGGRKYAPMVEFYEGDVQAIEIQPQVKYRPFGLIPGIRIRWLHLEPWLVGYFAITIPFVFILRRVSGIC